MTRRRTSGGALGLSAAAAAVATLFLALAAVVPADAHGYLAVPKSRNKIAHERGEYYCPQCGQGQGGEPGVCGDPYQDWSASDFDTRFYGTQATYTVGDVVSLNTVITAQHGGRMSYSVCPLPRDQLTRANLATALACFNDPKNFLTRADGPYAGSRFQYLLSGQGNVTVNWKLPAGVSCDNGCVLRWYWTAYQTCAMPCLDPSIDIPSQCGRKILQLDPATGAPLAPACTTDCCRDPSPTERFSNCADVVILSSGSTTPPPPPPPTSPAPPTPSPSPVPMPPAPPPSNTDCSTPACFCQGKADGLYVNPFDSTCASYIQCWNSGTSSAVQQCAAGTRFSMVLKYCDWAANVDCPSAPSSSPSPAPVASPSPSPKPPSPSPVASPSPSPKPPSPSPSPSPKPASPSPSPAPTPSPSPKPPSPSPSPAPPAPVPSPSPSPSGCTTATCFCSGKADGLYANPWDSSCNSYFQCWNGGKSGALQKCSTGLVFNPTRAYCDWPYNYTCPGGGTPPPPSSSPSPAPAPGPTPSPSPAPQPPPPPASPSPAPPPPPAPSPAPVNPLLPSAKLVVGYYQTWSSPWASSGANLDLAKTPSHVNVVILSFAKPECTYTKGSYALAGTGLDFSSDGTVVRDAVKILKANNPGTRVLLAVGGATYTNFAALNTKCVKDLVDDLGLDGADIDYEPSNPACQRLSGGGVKCATDAESVDVVTKFRAAMPKGSYILSTASWHVGCYGVGAYANSLPASIYTGVNLAMAKSAAGSTLDLINLMSYDAGGPASTGFSWRESFLSTRVAWPTAAVAVGVEVPPEAWGGFVSDAADVQARADFALANGGAGLMIWSLQKPGNPSPKTVASIACTKFGTCSSAAWPFPGSAR